MTENEQPTNPARHNKGKQGKLLRRATFLLSAAFAGLTIGCGTGVAEVAIAVTVIKLVCVAGLAVLAVQGAYWKVEAARLDAKKKELELEGVKDGQKVKAVVALTDAQVKEIQKTGQMEVQFEDGKKAVVKVTH